MLPAYTEEVSPMPQIMRSCLGCMMAVVTGASHTSPGLIVCGRPIVWRYPWATPLERAAAVVMNVEVRSLRGLVYKFRMDTAWQCICFSKKLKMLFQSNIGFSVL